MRKFSAASTIAFVMLTNTAQAQDQCWAQTSSVSNSRAQIERQGVPVNLIVELPNGNKQCSTTVPLQVNSQWINVSAAFEWTPGLQTQESACAMAAQLAVSRWATDQRDLQVTQTMVCSDHPQLSLRRVQEGDLVAENQVIPHPTRNQPFVYNNTMCKWFIEPEIQNNNVYQWQGVICQIRPDVWQVVNKF